jgi:hypothetical protein
MTAESTPLRGQLMDTCKNSGESRTIIVQALMEALINMVLLTSADADQAISTLNAVCRYMSDNAQSNWERWEETLRVAGLDRPQ